MKRIPIASVCICLPACVGPGPGITGNDGGGIIPYALVAAQGGSDRAVAQAMAAEHCGRYRKFAVITSIHRQLGDYVGFICTWSRSRPTP